MAKPPKVAQYYDQVAEDYHKIYQPEKKSYKNGVGDYFRLQILLRLIAQAGVKSVYEIGVGDGSPLAAMHKMGLRVSGCDIALNMVETARKRFVSMGVENPGIICADIEDSITLAPQLIGDKYDALVCLGVMPHVRKDRLALDNMRALVKTGGKLYVEFRNSLFSLFSMNRYTHEFITEELLAGVAPAVVERVSRELKGIMKMDKPAVRSTIEGKKGPGYDLILSKFHNPLRVPALLAESGFDNAKYHWYHFHAAMPWLAGELGDQFDEESMKLEHYTTDWRGMFLCSAVLVEADAV